MTTMPFSFKQREGEKLTTAPIAMNSHFMVHSPSLFEERDYPELGLQLFTIKQVFSSLTVEPTLVPSFVFSFFSLVQMTLIQYELLNDKFYLLFDAT